MSGTFHEYSGQWRLNIQDQETEMRWNLKTWCMIFVLVLFAFQAAAQRKTSILNDFEIKASFSEPPNLPTGGFSMPSTQVRKWLTILVSYKPEISLESKRGKNTKAKYRWLDELNIDIWVIIPGAENYGSRVLLGGKQILWSVPCDGKMHHALFVIPAMLLERYGNLPKYNKTIAEQIPIYVEFKTKNQELLGRFMHVSKGENRNRMYKVLQSMIDANVGVFKLPNAVLPKDKSPWNIVDIDSFDLPKNMVEGK